MKVLHVGEYVQGGVATYIKLLLQHPEDNDIEDYLVCSDQNSEHMWKLPDNRILYYNYKRGIIGGINAIRRIYGFVKKINPDVIYCHSTWAGVFFRFPLIFLNKKNKFLVIYNAHGWPFLRDTANWKKSLYAFIERILSNVTDYEINVSTSEYDAAIRYGLRGKKQRLITSGISSVRQNVDKNGSTEFSDDKINILFVGRFDRPKGLDYLLNEFHKCERKDLHLHIVGNSVVGDNVSIESKNEENITFWGWVPHEHLASYYTKSDVVIMPSRWEAFGFVAVEGMKYSKPIIVSNRGALPELVRNNQNGYVFDFDDPKTLQSIFLLLDKRKLKIMGKHAYNIFLKFYKQEYMIKKTISLYRNGFLYNPRRNEVQDHIK